MVNHSCNPYMTTKVTFGFAQYRGSRSLLKHRKKSNQETSLIVVQSIVFTHHYEWSQLLYVVFFGFFLITSSSHCKGLCSGTFHNVDEFRFYVSQYKKMSPQVKEKLSPRILTMA